MIWSQKLAQQTSRIHQQKTQKVHNFPDDLITKISTTNSTTNHKNKHKQNTTFRLKKHNFPAQKFTTAAPRLSWTCSRLGPASPAWAWILLEGRATR